MKYPVYAVRDCQIGFNSPMVDVNDNVAKRNFAYAINNPGNNSMNFAPKDFDLFKVGEFDTETGALIPLDVPVLIVSGTSVYGSEVK